MQTRTLGHQKLKVSAIGLGCMGMSEFYGETNDAESINTLKKAYDLGITFFDTADMYGSGHNEKLLGQAIGSVRDKVIIATKCGLVRDPDNAGYRGVNGSADYITACCEASLKRLNLEYIDLFYLHRIDPNTPIETSVTAMANLVKQGKIKHIGLSEAGAEIIRRAHRIHPITAIQSEYSLWTRGVEQEVLKVCQELNIGFVPYSPIGRGFLTGKIQSSQNLAADDFRKNLPRFSEENLNTNLKMVAELTQLAQEKGCSTVQLALAWVLAQGDYIVPIPGTRRVKYLEENVGAVKVHLNAADLARIDEICSANQVAGDRYPTAIMDSFNLSK
ncbi:MAG TPA: aldo/keto reductase [Gammaproteobacteria bacterium]|nr:aldo/keto reductase [Gammaproteobacteria bacterium]